MQICHDVPERRLRKDKQNGIKTRTVVICCSSLQLAAVQDHTVGDLRAFCAQCVGGQAQNVDKTWKKSTVEHLARLDNAWLPVQVDDARTRSEKRSFQTTTTHYSLDTLLSRLKWSVLSEAAMLWVVPCEAMTIMGGFPPKALVITGRRWVWSTFWMFGAHLSSDFQDIPKYHDMSWRWLHCVIWTKDDYLRWSLSRSIIKLSVWNRLNMFNWFQLNFGAWCSPSRTTASHWKMPDCWTRQSDSLTCISCLDQTRKYGQIHVSLSAYIA